MMKGLIVDKGWGAEEIFADSKLYCGKLLIMRSGKKMSMHFHMLKHETWRVLSGEFSFMSINVKDASVVCEPLHGGDVVIIPPGMPHQLVCHEAGIVLEVSTVDDPDDNYRVLPGDSQTEPG